MVLIAPAFADTTYFGSQKKEQQQDFFDGFFRGVGEFFGSVHKAISPPTPTPNEQKEVSDEPEKLYYSNATKQIMESVRVVPAEEEKEFNEMVRTTNRRLALTQADYDFLTREFGENYHVHVFPIYSDGSVGKGAHVVKCGGSLELIVAGEAEPCRATHDVELKVKWEYLKNTSRQQYRGFDSITPNLFNGNVQIPLEHLPALYSLQDMPTIKRYGG